MYVGIRPDDMSGRKEHNGKKIMNTIDILFSISTGLFLLASYPMIKKLCQNKDSLKGLSFHGSFLTFMGMLVTLIAFAYLGAWASWVLSLPTFGYGGLATWYTRA